MPDEKCISSVEYTHEEMNITYKNIFTKSLHDHDGLHHNSPDYQVPCSWLDMEMSGPTIPDTKHLESSSSNEAKDDKSSASKLK